MSAPLLTIVIPCFNEGERIERTARQVEAFVEREGLETQIVLVDDGSADDTGARIAALADASEQIEGASLPENRGKGAAIARGVSLARAPYIVFFDADLAYPLETVLAILARLRDGADLAIGARDLEAGGGRARYNPVRRAASHLFSALAAAALDLGEVRDTQCGIKGFGADQARALFERATIEGFGFDIEILVRARAWGLRVDRVPVEMRSTGAGSSVRLARDSARMLSDLGRVWWNRRAGLYARPRAGRDGEPE